MREVEGARDEAAVPLLGTAHAVVVRVGGAALGLRITQVREVSPVPPITRLPFPPPAVRGVASARGAVIPVIDLGERLFGSAIANPTRLVVVEDPGSGSEIGLLVESVTGLVAIEGELQAPPAEVEASLPAGWIAGVVTPEPERLVTLLNLAPVLALSDEDDDEENR